MHIINKAYFLFFMMLPLLSCKVKNKNVSPEDINALKLKRGDIVLCSPADKNFGMVSFDISCPKTVTKEFNLALSLLHSFEYDEAEKVFAKIIDSEPDCAMAYWGVAMCNFHPLWTPSSEAELEKGAKAIEIAMSLDQKSQRESDYIEAIAMYFNDAGRKDHHTRCILFENAMKEIYRKYPDDKEAAVFYALALDAAADPKDKSYKNQRNAGAILNTIYPDEPNHPGIVHYIIHTYDYPGLAELALPAARKYASIAPASAHAQHMPSHIFTRLGLWDESIKSNLISTSSAKCYAENASINGHWDEELHGMDYLVYAYLQKGDVIHAKEQWDYLKTIQDVYPVNFKVAYAFAAIPSRYLLENKMWKDATHIAIHPVNFPWEKFSWQKAIIHFTRLIGFVHKGNLDSARTEFKELNILRNNLLAEKDKYKANQVEIQIKESEALILFKTGEKKAALDLMKSAADMEDGTEKHPVTPGQVVPARELLADMFLETGNYSMALEAYLEDLSINPNRFNGLYGAGAAAEKLGDRMKAEYYYKQLIDQSVLNSPRPELAAAKLFLRQ